MRSFLASAAIVLGLLGPAHAVTISLGSSKDASIFQNNPDNSNGAGPGIFTGTNSTVSARRGLIEFDLSGIPAGSIVTQVDLTMYLGQVAGGGSQPTTIGLHRLQADWSEGTTGSTSTSISGTGQGFAANAGDTTWSARAFPATLWAAPGGDFAAAASSSLAVGAAVDQPFTWPSTAALVSDVQVWVDNPGGNVGWMLVNANESVGSTVRAFYTREAQFNSTGQPIDPVWRPTLVVTYTPIPEPAGMLLLAMGMICLAGWRYLR
jgi:hypothetical protein